MKKRKTIKYKSDSPMNYQFGGNTNFDFFNNLNNTWGNFWKRGGNAGDYFKVKADPYTYDPTKPTVNDPFGGNELARTVAMNNNVLSDWQNNKKTLADNSGYTGAWGDDAHNYYYNKTLNGAYTESELSGFANFEKQNFSGKPVEATKYAFDNNIDYNKYNAWNKGRNDYANTAGGLYDTEASKRKVASSLQPGYDKAMSGALTNTASGIFSGYNYLNAYKPEKPIDLQNGFQGIMNAQTGLEIPQYGLPEISMTKQTNYPAPQYGAPTTTQAPIMGIVQNLQKHGYSFPADFNKKPLQEQKQTVDNYIADFNQKQSKRNSQIEGTLIHTQTRPLSADFLSTAGNQDDEFKMWFAEQVKSGKVGTIQNYKGKPINIQLGGKSDNGSGEGKQKYISGLAKDLYNMQVGGEVNLTGYTQGSPTANNKINIIPGSEGTMQGVAKGTRLLGIGVGGAHNGFLKILDETTPNFSFKSPKFAELLIDKPEQQPQIQQAQFGSAVQSLYDQMPNIGRSYLDQIAGTAQYGPSASTPEFNQRMIQGATNAAMHNSGGYYQQGVPIGTQQEEVNPYNVGANNLAPQVGTTPQQTAGLRAAYASGLIPGLVSNDFYAKGASTKSKPSQVYNLKDDSVYNYTQDANGNWLARKKTSNGEWLDMKTRLPDDKYKKAVGLLDSGKYIEAKTNSGATKTTKARVAADVTGGRTNVSTNPLQPQPEDFSPAKTYEHSTPGIDWSNNALSGNLIDRSLIPANNSIKNKNAPSIDPYNTSGLYDSRGAVDSADSQNFITNQSTGYNFQVTDQNPTNNSQSAAPISYFKQKGLPYQETPDQVYLNNMNAVNANMGVSGGGLWLTTLPKVGKVIQYGSKYIDKAGNYVSKSGTKLGKASKDVLDKVRKFTENDWIEQSKNNPYHFNPLKPTEFTVGTPRFAAPVSNTVRTAWAPVPKQFGGYIPTFQYGGEVNNDYAYPIHPITEEFTDIQTEKGEVVTLPDGTIVDVKATELHKNMDKNDITDILPGKSHVFSNDPKMKLDLDSSIGGVKIKDMKLGKTTFEYKENQITVGPKDIMLSDIWGKKKELTPAELVNNVKTKFELRDNKNNFLTQRANEENKEQRLLYLDVIKAFSEYKKPKSKRDVPKAQYGMQLPSMNVGLPNIYNQESNNAIDGMLGFNNKALDPYSNMDNTMKSMYNVSSVVNPKLYQDGGDIPHAQLGKLLRYTSPVAYFGSEYFANKAKRKQEQENMLLNNEVTGYRKDLQNTIDTSGNLGVATNLATYMAGLNVPRQLYDDQSEQLALANNHYRLREADLQAQKYSQLNSLGGAGSLARYTNPNNMGQYLAASQQGYNQNVSNINSQIGSVQDQKVQNIMNLLSQKNAGYNDSENAYRNQLYNVNVAGIGNVGKSVQEATINSGDTRYRLGMEKMAFDQYLKDKAQGARDKVIGNWEGALNTVGQVAITAATGGFGAIGMGGSGGSGNSSIPNQSSFIMGAQKPNMPNFYNPNTSSTFSSGIPTFGGYQSNYIPSMDIVNRTNSQNQGFQYLQDGSIMLPDGRIYRTGN